MQTVFDEIIAFLMPSDFSVDDTPLNAFSVMLVNGFSLKTMLTTPGGRLVSRIVVICPS